MRILSILFLIVFMNCDNSFDFKESPPLDLLNYLCEKSKENFFIVNPDSVPSNWLTIDDIPNLMNKIESERITTPVFSINAGIDLKYKNRTTEGVEALFMIESVRKNKKYPSALSSVNCGVLKNGIFYPDTILIIEVKSWYKNMKNNQPSEQKPGH